MKLFDILQTTEYQVLQGEDKEIRSLTIDSRTARNGSLFFCIKGLKSDGHKFMDMAAEQGAVAIVIEEEQDTLPQNITIIKVKDTRKCLAYISANFYGKPADTFDLIGVTGTNGKTSTTYFMETILQECGYKSGLIGTVQTRVGEKEINIHTATSTTPDTIELHQMFSKMQEEQVDTVVMEVTSHALALHKTEGLRYKIAIFTNLTQDHLDFHGSMEEYKKAKAQLFQICDTAVMNVDDAAYSDLLNGCECRVVTYSIDKPSDLRAEDITFLDNGVTFKVLINNAKEEFFIPVPGRFTIYNALGVIGAALAMDINIEKIQLALKNMKEVPGRIQAVPNNRGIHIIVDYAHTPDSLKNIILAVREITKGKLITVFGCGGDRDKTKRPLMGKIAAELSDYCVITSDNPRTEEPTSIIDDIEPSVKEVNCPYVKLVDRKEAIQHAIKIAQKGDSVIIAGKGHENYQIFADRTVYFDDKEIALEYLEFLGNN